jgi:hypothetical protein
MKPNDAPRFAETLSICLNTFGRPTQPQVIEFWLKILEGFEIADVLAAFSRWMATEDRAPVPANIVKLCSASSGVEGWLGAEEAWALVPKSEHESAVMNQVINEAYGICQGLIACRDLIAARMAFKSAYERLADVAKMRNEQPKWFFSRGTDPYGVAAVLVDAVRTRRLPQDFALKHLREDLKPDFLRQLGAKDHPILASADVPQDSQRLRLLLDQIKREIPRE